MDRMFHAYKFKYDLLNREFLPSRASGTISRINIYINLDDFYHRIHKPYTNLEFQTTGQNVSKQIVSNLMNLIAHYKNWAAKERMQPVIFLIYTTSDLFKNGMRIPTYRDHYRKIFNPSNPDFFHINQAITNGYTILQVMTKYVHNVYAINSSYLEPSAIPLFLSRQYHADFHLIVSRDEYDLQYVAMNRWAVIMPKGEDSILINKGNVWEYITEKNNSLGEYYFHPELFLWAKTIIGDKYRGIPKLTRTGWKTVLKYLEKVSNKDLSDETLAIQLNELRKFIEERKIQDTNFNNNLYCTSVKQQVDALLDSDKAIIIHQIQDMEDIKALQEVNETIFKEYPIELVKLLREAPAVTQRYQTHDDYVWRKLLTAQNEEKKAKREAEEAEAKENKEPTGEYKDIYTFEEDQNS